ncbi:MAG: glycosyltransferase family A protein [Deltaproteobacteria bacterium]|nr:glycosyltransferase family A protein [Deltaproteobacteria bacterium]
MTENALISVIIPVYNGERYIAKAIKSVLAQEYKNIEIIAVNDGSTDGTEEVLRSYANVQYLYQPRKGASAARNSGIKCSSGDFIAFLDADDLWTKDKLKIQNSLFMDDHDLDMVFGHVEQFYSPELEDSLKGRIHLVAGSMPGYIPGAMLIKRISFLKVGFFDEGFRIGEFIDWYMRAVDHGLKSFIAREVVLKRRIHDANAGIKERDYRKDYLRVLKASLDRRRKTKKKVEAVIE